GMAMAIQTPSHVERVGAPRDRHITHRTVAGGAADAFVHMDAVIEIDKLGQGVDSCPAKRAVRLKTRAHRVEHGSVHPDLGVASHTGSGRRESGKGRPFHRCVAISTVDAKLAGMMFMAEGNWLFAGFVGFRVPGRLLNFVESVAHPTNNEHGPVNAHLGNGIRAAMKYLSHRGALRDSCAAALQLDTSSRFGGS